MNKKYIDTLLTVICLALLCGAGILMFVGQDFCRITEYNYVFNGLNNTYDRIDNVSEPLSFLQCLKEQKKLKEAQKKDTFNYYNKFRDYNSSEVVASLLGENSSSADNSSSS